MSTFGTVSLKEIQAMLQACAPGHTFRAHGDHKYIVTYKDKTFPSLPKGEHGKVNPGIQKGVIKKMARHLGILGCAQEQLGL